MKKSLRGKKRRRDDGNGDCDGDGDADADADADAGHGAGGGGGGGDRVEQGEGGGESVHGTGVQSRSRLPPPPAHSRRCPHHHDSPQRVTPRRLTLNQQQQRGMQMRTHAHTHTQQSMPPQVADKAQPSGGFHTPVKKTRLDGAMGGGGGASGPEPVAALALSPLPSMPVVASYQPRTPSMGPSFRPDVAAPTPDATAETSAATGTVTATATATAAAAGDGDDENATKKATTAPSLAPPSLLRSHHTAVPHTQAVTHASVEEESSLLLASLPTPKLGFVSLASPYVEVLVAMRNPGVVAIVR